MRVFGPPLVQEGLRYEDAYIPQPLGRGAVVAPQDVDLAQVVVRLAHRREFRPIGLIVLIVEYHRGKGSRQTVQGRLSNKRRLKHGTDGVALAVPRGTEHTDRVRAVEVERHRRVQPSEYADDAELRARFSRAEQKHL